MDQRVEAAPEQIRTRRLEWVITAAGLLWIAVLRLAGLTAYFRIEADEGGWPLAVRQWLEDGTRTYDFYMAPGYHWLLGSAFWLLGAEHGIARAVSAIWGLAGLWLFHRLAARLAGPQTAWWSVLVFGSSYYAIQVYRRALIEPYQVTLMLALGLVVVEARRGWPWVAGLVTALLLLTKASAIFLLPALTVASLWPGPVRETWRRALGVAGVLSAGLILAAAVFAWFYAGDPATFLEGWTKDMRVVNMREAGETGGEGGAAADGGGRFALNLVSTGRTLRYFGTVDPVLLVLAALGLGRALRTGGRHPLMLAWLLAAAAFLGLQMYVAPQHRAILIVPMCFLAGWRLTEWDRGAARRLWCGGRLEVTWPRLFLVAMMALATGRMLVADGRFARADTGGARWLSSRTAPGEVVVAAPYVLMQLGRIRPVSFFTLPGPFLPAPDVLAARQAAWIVVDDREWLFHMTEGGAAAARIDGALGACCELAHTAPGSRVYRVRPAAAPAR